MDKKEDKQGMPNGYPNELRFRILDYYDDNHTQKETCAVFQISRSTLCAWLKLRQTTGSAELKPRPKQRHSKINEEPLRSYIGDNPDAYFHEIAEVFKVSGVAILYACRRYGITRKKS